MATAGLSGLSNKEMWFANTHEIIKREHLDWSTRKIERECGRRYKIYRELVWKDWEEKINPEKESNDFRLNYSQTPSDVPANPRRKC